MVSCFFKELRRAGFIIAGLILLTLSLTESVQSREFDLSGNKVKYAQSLLRTAKIAVEEGKTEKARLLWLKIRSLNVPLSMPSWLKEEIASGALPVRNPDKTNITETSEVGPKKHFETQLKANPFNNEARKALYRIAQRDGDKIAMLRHKSILQPKTSEQPNQWLKLLMGILLFTMVIWGLLSPLPGVKDKGSQQKTSLISEIFKFFKKTR